MEWLLLCYYSSGYTKAPLCYVVRYTYIACLVFVVCCVGSGLCDGLITRPEESYRLWCVVVVCCQVEVYTTG